MATIAVENGQTRRYAEKRERILAAASEIINACGVRDTTLTDVAARVGLVTTSVTYYFRRKEELAAACFLRSIAAYDAIVTDALRAPTAQGRMALFASGYISLRDRIDAGEAPPLAQFNDIRALHGPQAETVFAAYADMIRHVRALFDTPECAWMDRSARSARAHLLLEQFFWASRWIRRYDREDFARVRDRVADILKNGLAARAGAWNPPPLAAVAGVPATAREAFLVAAIRTINEHGASGASVERISARLNVTKGSFYHHNDAKDELVVACFRRTFDVIRAAQHAAFALPANGYDRLCAAVDALVRFQYSDAGPLLRTSAMQALPAPLRAGTVEASGRLARRFAALIADGVADGSIRAVDPAIAAEMVMAMVYSSSRLPHWLPGAVPDAGSRHYARPLLVGMFRE